MTMRNWPKGLPLALKMREVTPMREAARVIVFSRSNIQKETRISRVEQLHSAISVLEKYAVNFLCQCMVTSKKRSIRIHIFKDLTMCKRMQMHFLPGGSYSVGGSIAHEDRGCKPEIADPGSRRHTNVSRGTGIFFQGP
jgi:hypothetical protein